MPSGFRTTERSVTRVTAHSHWPPRLLFSGLYVPASLLPIRFTNLTTCAMSTLKDPGLSLSLFLLAAARSVRPRALTTLHSLMKTPCAASPPPFRLTCRVKRTKIYLDCAASAASVLQTSPNYSTKIPRIPVPTPHDQNATHTRAPNRSSSVLHRGGATEFVLSTRTDSLTASDRSVMQSLAPTHAPFHPPPVMLPYVRTCFTGLLRWSGSVLGNVTSSRRDRWHLTQSATGASFKQCNPQIRISNNRQTLWTSSARCVFGKLVRRKPENMLMHTCRKLIQPSILPGLSAAATHARVQHSSQTLRRPDTCPRRVFT
jgi:hypothetical protein